MKTCFKCGHAKPLAEFYKHPKMADGHLNKCRACTCADAKANTAKKPIEERRTYIREYMRTHRVDRAKLRARNVVTNELRRGRIQRGPCEVGDDCHGKIEAHHADYARPLDIQWLCRKHHELVHRL